MPETVPDLDTLHARLGIPPDYGRRRGAPMHREADDLIVVGYDCDRREYRMTPAAATAWRTMRTAAAADGVVLRPVSAFRSWDYQAELLRAKLADGVPIAEALEVIAPPGYSEHHTGRALDITTPGFEDLSVEFESSRAFVWLQRRADEFGFAMSYPPGNPAGFVYEPWHWTWDGSGGWRLKGASGNPAALGNRP